MRGDVLRQVPLVQSANGRFRGPRPTGLGPDVNPYRYCGNSPTNYTDPTGLDTIPIPVEENAGPSWEADRE